MTSMSSAYAAEAIRAYDEYFRLCVLRPELASYESAKQNLGISKPVDLWNSHQKDDSRYVWFVAYLLKVTDDLISYAPDYFKQENIMIHLADHEPALKAIWKKHWKSSHSAKLGELMKQVIKGDTNA